MNYKILLLKELKIILILNVQLKRGEFQNKMKLKNYLLKLHNQILNNKIYYGKFVINNKEDI